MAIKFSGHATVWAEKMSSVRNVLLSQSMRHRHKWTLNKIYFNERNRYNEKKHENFNFRQAFWNKKCNLPILLDIWVYHWSNIIDIKEMVFLVGCQNQSLIKFLVNCIIFMKYIYRCSCFYVLYHECHQYITYGILHRYLCKFIIE